LSADKLTLCHVRRAAGSLAAHSSRITPEEPATKPKQMNLNRWPIVAENQIFQPNRLESALSGAEGDVAFSIATRPMVADRR